MQNSVNDSITNKVNKAVGKRVDNKVTYEGRKVVCTNRMTGAVVIGRVAGWYRKSTKDRAIGILELQIDSCFVGLYRASYDVEEFDFDKHSEL